MSFRSPLELLVSVMLSAQTTDVNVNRVTEKLFVKYRKPEDYLAVPPEELERNTRSQEALWAHGISGDLPILLVSVVGDEAAVATLDDAPAGHRGVDEARVHPPEHLVVEARAIRSKYVAPPHTTDFGIMFLPTEGLYAEVLRRPGLVESLQRDCRIAVAGPTTLLALMTSFQMGFRTLAIERASSDRIAEVAVRQGMRRLRDDGVELRLAVGINRRLRHRLERTRHRPGRDEGVELGGLHRAGHGQDRLGRGRGRSFRGPQSTHRLPLHVRQGLGGRLGRCAATPAASPGLAAAPAAAAWPPAPRRWPTTAAIRTPTGGSIRSTNPIAPRMVAPAA